MDPSNPLSRSSFKNALEIVLWTILLLGGYSAFKRATGIGAVLLESNLQSNLARISRYVHAPKANIVIVGSSMTGRLLPSYFDNRVGEVFNLGLDGCHVPLGLEIILMRKDLPKTILVETASLYNDPNANEAILREAITSPTFRMTGVVELFRPENRPLSLLYWWIKSFSDRKPGKKIHVAMIRGEKSLDTPPEKQSNNANKELDDRGIRDTLLKLKQGGADVRLLSIPHGDGWGIPESGRIKKISEDLKIPIVEPGVSLSKTTDTLRFTDGVHLDVASSKLISAQIIELLKVPPNQR